MKKEKIMICGVLLALMIFIQACGLTERFSFEADKKQAFLSASALNVRESGLFFPDVLESYKNAGIKFVTVTPKTLEEFENLGKLSTITYSSLSINEDAVSVSLKEALAPYGLNEKSIVALLTDPMMAETLRKNLIAKYPGGFFIEKQTEDGLTAFAFPTVTEKNLMVGYDEEEVYLIKAAGLIPCMEYPAYTYETENYPHFLREFIRYNNIPFMIIRENENENKISIPENVKKVLKEEDITLVVYENENQVSNEKPYIYQELKTIFREKVIRGGNIDKLDLYDSSKYMYRVYQWFNSALERNVTFINVNMLKNPDIIPDENWELTGKAAQEFIKRMENLGYTFPNKANNIPYRFNLQTSAMCGAVVLICLLYLYLSLLLGKKAEDKELYFLISCTALIILSFVFYNVITKYYAMLIMTLAVSLITLILFKLNASDIPFKTKLSSSLICPPFIMLTGAVSISSLISDFEFFLGDKWLYEVPITLILPILLTVLNYVFVYIGTKKEDLKKFSLDFKAEIKKFPLWLIITLGVLLVLVLAYYIIRAGKSELILPLEQKIRNVLTDVLIIRPRFKEFLIGYPAFSLFIYFSYFRKNKYLSKILGFVQVILFISILNTFCHAQTALWVSLIRTLTGFASGLLVSGIIIGISEIIYLVIKKLRFLPKKA